MKIIKERKGKRDEDNKEMIFSKRVNMLEILM
jgi:hypothetical protein